MIEVAKLTMSVDPMRNVRRAIGRVALSELDARRDTAHPPGAGGISFYLMSALDLSDDVPEDAIELIKRTVGRAFRANAERWKAFLRADTAVNTPWALLETHGHNVRLRTAARGPTANFLTSFTQLSHDVWELAPAAASKTVRILLEYAPPIAEHGDETRASLERSLEDLATKDAAAEAVAPATVDTADASPRERILAHSLSAPEVLLVLGTRAEDATSWASRERRGDRLFGAWSRSGREFVHPDFQFQDSKVHPRLPELLTVLRTRAGFDPIDKDKGGWARAYWLYQPHPGLSAQALAAAKMDLSDTVTAAMTLGQLDDAARSPAEMFATEADAVIALARELSPDGEATA